MTVAGYIHDAKIVSNFRSKSGATANGKEEISPQTVWKRSLSGIEGRFLLQLTSGNTSFIKAFLKQKLKLCIALVSTSLSFSHTETGSSDFGSHGFI